MTFPDALARLVGRWSGTSALHLSATAPARESASDATIEPVASGKFLAMRYTWREDGLQDGLLLLGADPKSGLVAASWIDSWHMGHASMACEGTLLPEGGASVKGTYPAPPGPDWGWRIVVEPRGDDRFRLTMYNLPPGGEDELAVRAEFARTG